MEPSSKRPRPSAPDGESLLGVLVIDGSQGEGGGQILRTSLTCAAITNRRVRIVKIRAGRPNPGLGKQHLVAVKAAAAVCGANLVGAALGSQELEFIPAGTGAIGGGELEFDIGSAGSTTLVLQTVIPILLFAKAPSRVIVKGGTHNPMAPPFEFLSESLTPLLATMGLHIELKLHAHGFYPAGGGRVEAIIQPIAATMPLTLEQRGEQVDPPRVVVLASRMKAGLLHEQTTALQALRISSTPPSVTTLTSSPGPGNAVLAVIRFQHITSMFTTVTDRLNSSAVTTTATSVASAVSAYLASTAPVDEHLADQLLLPMALVSGGSFRATMLSTHFHTNAAVLSMFFGPCVAYENLGGALGWRVTVTPAAGLRGSVPASSSSSVPSSSSEGGSSSSSSVEAAPATIPTTEAFGEQSRGDVEAEIAGEASAAPL